MPALSANGSDAASTNRNPPTGPAIMFCITCVPPPSQPLARSSSERGTTAGSTACAAVRNTTSPVFTTNSTAYSSAIPARSASIATASTASAPTRTQSMSTISRRRSTRSASTPPGSANSSHGSHDTAAPADTTSGSSVIDATYSGAATVAVPLPSADSVLAVHSRAKRPPSRSPVTARQITSDDDPRRPVYARRELRRAACRFRWSRSARLDARRAASAYSAAARSGSPSRSCR